jgi:hypothetical protein
VLVAVIAAGLNAVFRTWSKRALMLVSTGLLPCLFLVAGFVAALLITSQPRLPGDMHGPGLAIAAVIYFAGIGVFGGLLLGAFVSVVTISFLRVSETSETQPVEPVRGAEE